MKQIRAFTKCFTISALLLVGLTTLPMNTYAMKKAANGKQMPALVPWNDEEAPQTSQEKELENDPARDHDDGDLSLGEIAKDQEGKDSQEERPGATKTGIDEEKEATPSITLKQFLTKYLQERGIDEGYLLVRNPKELERLFGDFLSCGVNHFFRCHAELQAYILSFLPHKDKVRTRKVCKTFKTLVEGDDAWPKEQRDLYEQMYGKKPGQVSWTEKEIQMFRRLYNMDPWKITKLPTLKVKASQLSSLAAFAPLVWRLKIASDVDIRTLSLLDRFRNLITLYLRCDTDELQGLRCFRNLTRLTRLGLYETTIIDTDLQHFPRSLRTLYLGQSTIEKTDLQDLSNLENLTSLDMSDSIVPDTVLMHLPRGLERLDLNRSDLTSDGLKYVANNCPNLIELNMEHTAITDDSLVCLANNCKKLIWLNLERTGITDDGLKHLVDNCKSITSLNLHRCSKITNACIPHLLNLPNLKELNMGGVPITGNCFTHIANQQTLTELNLEGTYLGDIGLKYLADNCKSITSLNLRKTYITDRGLKYLVDNCQNISSLNLQECARVTDDGLRYLLNLPNLKELALPKYVTITPTDIQWRTSSSIRPYYVGPGSFTKWTHELKGEEIGKFLNSLLSD